MVSIALSIPLTTDAMFPVTYENKKSTIGLAQGGVIVHTCRMVTAVSTRLATASMRLASRSKLMYSLFFRIAFDA